MLVYFPNCSCHVADLGWCLHNLCPCWEREKRRKVKPPDLSREQIKGLRQECQSKGTELSIVLRAALWHLLALQVGPWLVSFEKKFYGQRTAESEKATRLCDPAMRAWVVLEKRKEREGTTSVSCCKEGRQLAWQRGDLFWQWNDHYFPAFQHGWLGTKAFSLAQWQLWESGESPHPQVLCSASLSLSSSSQGDTNTLNSDSCCLSSPSSFPSLSLCSAALGKYNKQTIHLQPKCIVYVQVDCFWWVDWNLSFSVPLSRKLNKCSVSTLHIVAIANS